MYQPLYSGISHIWVPWICRVSLINFLRELANESKRLLEGDASIGEHCICLVMTESINIVPPPLQVRSIQARRSRGGWGGFGLPTF